MHHSGDGCVTYYKGVHYYLLVYRCSLCSRCDLCMKAPTWGGQVVLNNAYFHQLSKEKQKQSINVLWPDSICNGSDKQKLISSAFLPQWTAQTSGMSPHQGCVVKKKEEILEYCSLSTGLSLLSQWVAGWMCTRVSRYEGAGYVKAGWVTKAWHHLLVAGCCEEAGGSCHEVMSGCWDSCLQPPPIRCSVRRWTAVRGHFANPALQYCL